MDDVVCTIGQEDRKLLHYDDFTCRNEDSLICKVGKETMAQMRTVN